MNAMKILIVDDNADDRKFLKFNLEHHACEVIEASDGAEGLHLANVEKPDLIVTDALMPVMDGFQFLRSIKTDETLRTIPFIFYSAVYTGNKEAELALSLGAEAFIIKPKDPREFWEELSGILEKFKLKNKKNITARLVEEDEEFLRKYSHIVAAKLEEKVKELEKARVQLIAAQDRLGHLLSYSPSVIYSLEPSSAYAVTFISENITALSGFTVQEFMEGLHFWQEHIHPDDAARVRQELAELPEQGRRITEYRFMHKDGTYRHLHDEAKIVRDDAGKPLEIIGSLIDITERNKLGEQLRQAQKMEAIGQLAGGVAHDFNNILSAIIGYGHIALVKMAADDPQRLNIENMLAGADRAAHLTKDLLLFSRKQISELKPVDLNESIMKVEKFLKRVIGEDIECKTMLQDQPLTVYADSHQLEQVLMNLATNARDAMPGGGAFTVTTEQVILSEDFVSVHGYGRPGAYALLTVSDTGKGMDEETRKRIFEPFFTTKEVGKGTGLGLAVVYGIVKQHEGFINVYSEPGKGSTFRIYLPITASTAEAAIVAPQEEAPARGTETILLAEDDETLRKLSRTVLVEYGYRVIEAVDGEDAIKKFIENKDTIQLLLFDIIMPKMNGSEAYNEIRKTTPDMKVIFASGYAPDLVRQKVSLEKGAHLVYKPMSPMALLRKVRSVLDGTAK